MPWHTSTKKQVKTDEKKQNIKEKKLSNQIDIGSKEEKKAVHVELAQKRNKVSCAFRGISRSCGRT